MKRIHIVNPYNSVAMRRLAEPLMQELPRLYEVSTSEAVDPAADLNFHMPWHTLAGLQERGEGRHVIAYTHVNPPDVLALFDACQRADLVTAMTFRGRDELIGIGADPAKLWTVYCAADQFDYGKRTIAMIGYPQPNGRKREHLLLDLAWQYDLSACQFLLVGAGWEQMAEQLKSLGVSALSVHLDTDEQLQELYRRIDVLLVTGYAEGGPLPLLEAMAAGVKVLSPDFGYAADLLTPNEIYTDAADLMGKLEALFARGLINHKLARSWSWKHYVREYALLFGRLLGEPMDIYPEHGMSRYAQILDIIDERRPASIAEIGTWNGDRAIQMIQAAARYRPASDIIYQGHDLFEGQTDADYRRELSKAGWEREIVQRRIDATGASAFLCQGYSRDTLVNLLSADLYFVDGGHSEATIEGDAAEVLAQLRAGQVAIFDDYYHAGRPMGFGCNKVIDGLDNGEFKVRHLPARTAAEDGRVIGMVQVERYADIRLQRRKTQAGGTTWYVGEPSYSMPAVPQSDAPRTAGGGGELERPPAAS